MRFIKRILFLLLIPASVYGQTVHIDEDKNIVYKGTNKVTSVNKEELYERAKDALLHNVKGSKEKIVTDNKESGMIAAKGSIRLASPYHLIRTVEYIFELFVDDENYKYRIDSVYVKQVERGGKTIKISSEKLFEGIEETGPQSAEAERQLNEIDMNFQKLIVLMNADMKKASVVKNKKRRNN